MSNYPELADVFVDKTGSDNISSSDPNNSYDAIENVQGLIGALGKPQSWSTTLMTLLRKYRMGMVLKLSGSNVLVEAGEAVLENTTGTKWSFRKNASDVTLGAANLDTGSLAVATYYVYAVAPTAGSTAPIKFSTDAYSPSGIGTSPYAKIGYFLNNAAGSLASSQINNTNSNAPVLRPILFRSDNTVYQADTDGWFVGIILGSANCNGYLEGYSDLANPPTVLMGGASLWRNTVTANDSTNNIRDGFSIPVRKTEYYKGVFTGTACFYTYYFVPLT